MKLGLQPLVDALRQHVAGGYASRFHTAVLTATPNVTDLQDHATGDALLRALLGRDPETPLSLVSVYVPLDGRWAALGPDEMAAHHTTTDMPHSLPGALAAALSSGAQAHFRDARVVIDTVTMTEVEAAIAGAVHLHVLTSNGPCQAVLAFGSTGLTSALSKTTTISGPALRAAGEQARQQSEVGFLSVLNDIQLSMPAASGAIN